MAMYIVSRALTARPLCTSLAVTAILAAPGVAYAADVIARGQLSTAAAWLPEPPTCALWLAGVGALAVFCWRIKGRAGARRHDGHSAGCDCDGCEALTETESREEMMTTTKIVRPDPIDDAASSIHSAVVTEAEEIADLAGRIPWETVSGLATRVKLRSARWLQALLRALLSSVERHETPKFLRLRAGV